MGSEREENIPAGLEGLLFWAQTHNKQFPKIKCILTDLPSSFINSFKKTLSDTVDTENIKWLWCIWHFKRAIRDKINNFKFSSVITSKLYKHFNYILYARNTIIYEDEKNELINFIKNSLVNPEISSAQKNNIQKFCNYSSLKFKHEKRWAYCFQDNIPLGTNMSLERFHGEIKNRYPKNGAVSPNHFIWILLGIWNNEFQKRLNYIFNPKKENMSYRLKKTLDQKEIAFKSENFSFHDPTHTVLEIGTPFRILEKN